MLLIADCEYCLRSPCYLMHVCPPCSVSGRKTLILQRTRFRLFRIARKIDSEYVTITAYEEAARCIAFDVFSHTSKTRSVMRVREVDTIQLQTRSPTPDEVASLKSKDILRIGRVFADRLTLKRPRGSTLPVLGWRKRGEGGRLLLQSTQRVTGELRVLSVYETEFAMTVTIYTPSWQDLQVFRLSPSDRLLLLGYEKLGFSGQVLAQLLERVMCYPRLSGLYVTTKAMVRMVERFQLLGVRSAAESPGAGGHLGGFGGVAGPIVGQNYSSAHKGRRYKREKEAAALGLEDDTRDPVKARVPIKCPDIMDFDRTLLRVAQRIGSHYAVITVKIAPSTDPAQHGLGSGDVVVVVYLPRMSLTYNAGMTAAQVNKILEDSRLEDWEKAMIAHEGAHKKWVERMAALRVQYEAAVKHRDDFLKEKTAAKAARLREEEIKARAEIVVSDSEEEDDEAKGDDASSINSEAEQKNADAGDAGSVGGGSEGDEEEEEEEDSDDERERELVNAAAAAVENEEASEPKAPVRPSGAMWPVASREVALARAHVSSYCAGSSF